MTIKLWNKKTEKEEMFTNVSLIEHRVLRNWVHPDISQFEVLLLTLNDGSNDIVAISLDDFNIDEIGQYNLSYNDNE